MSLSRSTLLFRSMARVCGALAKPNRLVCSSLQYARGLSQQPPAPAKAPIGDFYPADWLDKPARSLTLEAVLESSTSTINGVGTQACHALQEMGVYSVEDLGNWAQYHVARQIKLHTQHPEISKYMHHLAPEALREALDVEARSLSFENLLACKPSVIQGLSHKSDQLLESIGIYTVDDLAEYAYAQRAEVLVLLSRMIHI